MNLMMTEQQFKKEEIQTLTRMSLKNLMDMVKKLLKLDQELANYLII